jgi:hypothetical protein
MNHPPELHVSISMKTSLQRPSGISAAERVAWVLAAAGGAMIATSVLAVFAGSLFRPEGGLLGVLLSDRFALLWITGASTAHLVFVPSFCFGVALRDRRREQAGIPIPRPRSIWRGHTTEFEEPRMAA